MPVPSPRNKILPARGNFADLQAGLVELSEGEICYAFDQDQYYQKEGGVLVAVGATKAQGILADSALQPGDNISELINDMGYLVAGDIVDAPVQSVNGEIGDVVLDASDVGLGNVDNTSDTDKPISTATQAVLDVKADLVDGVIPTSQIPAIALTEFLGDVASEAAMLALDGQPGDWCFRSDEGFGYVIVATPPSVLSSWQQVATPGGDVNSVNGQTGTVVLSAADVGAIPATDAPNFAPSTVDLQAVTDNGNTTTNVINLQDVQGRRFALEPPTASTVSKLTTNRALLIETTGNDPINFSTNNANVANFNADGSASFGSGNITLSSSGSASFTDTVTSNQADTSGYFFKGAAANNTLFEVQSDGQLALRKTDGTATIVLFGADGSASFGAGNISLNADGDGTFTGNGTFIGGATYGAYVTFGTSLGGRISGTGSINLNRPNDTISAAIRVCQIGDGTPTVEIGNDGSASFGAGNISLNANGSASFVNNSVNIGSTGDLDVSRNSADDSALISYYSYSPGGTKTFTSAIRGDGIYIGTNLSDISASNPSSQNITLNADGQAVFDGATDGKVTVSGATAGSNAYLTLQPGNLANAYLTAVGGQSGALFFGTGSVATAQACVATDGSFNVGGTLPTSAKITLKADGSATFAGQINGTTVGTSDERFKENIAPANPQLDDVVALGGLLKNFDWNEDAPVNDEIRATRQLGLIAQEAEVICPSLIKTISRTKQGEELTPEQIIPAVYEDQEAERPTGEVDEEGNEIMETVTEQVLVTPEEVIPATYEELDDSYKGISHDALVMKLLGAVAELTARVEELERELHA